MKKFGKILLICLGFGLVTLTIGFLTNPPTPVQGAPGPAPVTVVNTPLPVNITNTNVPVVGTVNANVTNTVPVSGAVNANITNATVPVSGTVNANVTNSPLQPQLASNTITLSASSLVSPGCTGNTAFEQFTFNTFVGKNSGVLQTFTLPAGQVLVVTNFSWVASGSSAVANQTRIASLLPSTSGGQSAADAQSTALTDSNGRAGGWQTFPTGIVLQNPAFFCLDLYPVVSGEVVSGTINGFLAPDR
jgi:hypothetical protein